MPGKGRSGALAGDHLPAAGPAVPAPGGDLARAAAAGRGAVAAGHLGGARPGAVRRPGRPGAGAVRRAGLLRPRAAARGARVNISNLIASYGYWAVFLLVGAESLGIPLPGETALITAGIYAGHTHRLSPWLIFAVAAAGAIIGDNIGYWIGDKGEYQLARRYGPKVPLDARNLKIAPYPFGIHGPKVV